VPDPSARPDSPTPVTVTVSRHFPHAPARVFDAWLDPAGVGQWLFATPDGVMEAVTLDPRVGGQFRIAERRGVQLAEHFGTYLEIDRSRRLAFAFAVSADGPSTRVTIDIVPEANGCRLTLTHDMDPQWIEYRDRTRDGWERIAESLDAHLDRASRLRTVVHDTVIVERRYPAAPARVFAAFADVDVRARWSVPRGDRIVYTASDFTVGGRDLFVCGPADAIVFRGDIRYEDIVADRRIVYVERMAEGERPIAASLITVEFEPDGSGTHLIMTAQIAALDGSQIVVGSVDGWRAVLENLAAEVG